MSLIAQSLQKQIKNARKVVGLQLETKDATPENQEEYAETIKNITEMVAKQGELMIENAEGFAELKKTNEERLKSLEKGRPDGLDDDKLKRINDDLNELKKTSDSLEALQEDIQEVQKQMNRPGFNSKEDQKDAFSIKHEAAFELYARKRKDTGLLSLEEKDAPMKIGNDEDGGFAVPESLERSILKLMREESPLRRIANIIKVGGPEHKKLVNKGGTTSGWVGETDPRTATDPSKIEELLMTVGEIYAYPGTTQYALDDIFFDVAAFIRDEVYDQFADEEALAFLSGDGVKKPLGLLSAPTSTARDKARAFGTAEYLPSGVAGEVTSDSIVSLPYRMKTKHRKKASWLMNSLTMSKVRLLKNAKGDYIWREGLKDGQHDTLNGLRIIGEENMPDVANDSFSMALGNWKRAYTIIDRVGVRFLRDPYNKLGYVYFYFTKRVGGRYIDTEAFKFIKCSAA